MTNPICKYCRYDAVFSFSPYRNPHTSNVRDPEWLFHIGIQCINPECKKWCGWVEQTHELMDFLKGAALISKAQIDGAIRNE